MNTPAPHLHLDRIADLNLSAHETSKIAALGSALARGGATGVIVDGHLILITRSRDADGVQDTVVADKPFLWSAALEGAGRNTLIEYLYRDASNHKASGTAVLSGRLSPEQIARFAFKLDDGNGFDPDQVGLDALQSQLGDWDDDSDHSIHELTRISYTDKKRTVGITADDFADAMAEGDW